MNDQVPARIEFKYLISEAHAALVAKQLQPWCGLDAHSARAVDHQYLIRSLYLDGPQRPLYRASRGHRSGRFKARVRSYGESGSIFFELKRKDRGIVRKSRARVPREQWEERLLGPCPPGASAFELDFRAQRDRHLLEPAVWVEYRREAWVGLFDDYARVTFDRKIRCQPSYRLSAECSPSAWVPLDNAGRAEGTARAVVLELKSSPHVPVWMQRLIERLELRRMSFSKYCLGIERCENPRARGLL